jgi:hypothetical protein
MLGAAVEQRHYIFLSFAGLPSSGRRQALRGATFLAVHRRATVRLLMKNAEKAITTASTQGLAKLPRRNKSRLLSPRLC